MIFRNAFKLFRQARLDANLSLSDLAEKTDLEVQIIQDFEKGELHPKLSSAKLNRIEEVLNLPECCFLYLIHNDVYPLHRTVTYQDFITPEGFKAWIDVLRRFVAVNLIPDENGIYDSHALAKVRETLEGKIKDQTMKLYAQGQITGGRARELLNLTAFDELPKTNFPKI